MLKQITPPKCLPVSLYQARKHLEIDTSDRSNDILIELLIESATADSQMKTGRVWVDSEWEWRPDVVALNSVIHFPLVPVTEVILYDLDEFNEPEIPTEPINPDEPEPPIDSENPIEPTEPAPENPVRKARYRISDDTGTDTPMPPDEPINPDEPIEPLPPQFTNIISDYAVITYPSLIPLGEPSVGNIVFYKDLPKNYKLTLKVGYGVVVREDVVEQFDDPVLVMKQVQFSQDKIKLNFTRAVTGSVYITNFEVRKRVKIVEPEPMPPDIEPEPSNPETSPDVYSDQYEDVIVSLLDAKVENGYVILEFPFGEIFDGDSITISFFEGALCDQFSNFVQPIINARLPKVTFVLEEEFTLPDPVPVDDVFESLAPSPIKNWILTRVGSLYTQRTEIALRAGKSNDAMFPSQFIDNLLNPYKVRFL